MYNHARTLLMNVLPEGRSDVDQTFRPITLRGTLAALRSILVGDGVDLEQRALNISALLRVIYACGQEHHLLALDPRIYEDVEKPLSLLRKVIKVDVSGQPANMSVLVSGLPTDSQVQNRYSWEWNIRTTTASPYPALEVLFGGAQTFYSYSSSAYVTLHDGLGDEFPLPPTGLKARFYFPSYVGEAVVPDNLNITVAVDAQLARPNLAEICAKLESSIDFADLLGTGGPFAEFRGLWKEHQAGAFKIAGFTLAVIYAMENLRPKE